MANTKKRNNNKIFVEAVDVLVEVCEFYERANETGQHEFALQEIFEHASMLLNEMGIYDDEREAIDSDKLDEFYQARAAGRLDKGKASKYG